MSALPEWIYPRGRVRVGRDCLQPQENRGDSCFQPAEWKLETLVLAQLASRTMVPSEGRRNQQRGEKM